MDILKIIVSYLGINDLINLRIISPYFHNIDRRRSLLLSLFPYGRCLLDISLLSIEQIRSIILLYSSDNICYNYWTGEYHLLPHPIKKISGKYILCDNGDLYSTEVPDRETGTWIVNEGCKKILSNILDVAAPHMGVVTVTVPEQSISKNTDSDGVTVPEQSISKNTDSDGVTVPEQSTREKRNIDRVTIVIIPTFERVYAGYDKTYLSSYIREENSTNIKYISDDMDILPILTLNYNKRIVKVSPYEYGDLLILSNNSIVDEFGYYVETGDIDRKIIDILFIEDKDIEYFLLDDGSIVTLNWMKQHHVIHPGPFFSFIISREEILALGVTGKLWRIEKTGKITEIDSTSTINIVI